MIELTGLDKTYGGRRILSGADLTGVMYDDNTIWPEGFTPPPSA